MIPFSTHTELKHVVDEFTVKHKRLKKGKLTNRYLGARGGAGLLQAILKLAFPDEDCILTNEEIDKYEYNPPEITEDDEKKGPNYQPNPNHLKLSGNSNHEEDKVEEEEEEEEENEETEEDEEEKEDNEEEACPGDLHSKYDVESASKDISKRKQRKYRVIGTIGHPNVGKS